jgi:sugar lactone lactonase YvrE
MKKTTFVLCTLLLSIAAFAQRPTDPKFLIPEKAPLLDYVSVSDSLPLPTGTTIGAPAANAFDSKNHMFVLNRGPQALAEFDANGKFIRLFGDGLLKRAHGLVIDKADNIWVTDVTENLVMKLNPHGKILLTLGTKGEKGDWNEANGFHFFDEPTGLAIGRNGDFFVSQGHSPGSGDPRILKFDANGKFIKTWGGRGTEPGKFTAVHGIAIDAKGLIWAVDRENQRIQIFDQDGKYIREMKYAGLPTSLWIGDQYIYMVNGFTGQLLRLDLNGKVLAAVGKPGTGLGEFGEAHSVTVGPKGEIWVADTISSTDQKFVKK